VQWTTEWFALYPNLTPELMERQEANPNSRWPRPQLGEKRLPYISRFTRPTCFRRAFLVPAGYSSPLFVGNMQSSTRECTNSVYLKEFARRFLHAFGVADEETEAVADSVRSSRG